MALVRNMLVQIARDYSREGAAKKICWEKHDADVAAGRTATPGPVSPQGPDRGGRELSLVATVTSIAEAFGHRDTHHEAAIAGFRFLASNEAFGRMALFAAPAAIGPLKGRQNTCRDLADRIKAHADAARIRTFDAIPGVLAQAAVIWTQVCADVAAHVEQVEAQILRAKDAVPPLADPRREAQEVQEAQMALAALSSGQMGYQSAQARLAAAQAAFEVARNSTGGGQVRENALAEIAKQEAALGRERQMLATWGREAQVLREASLLLNGDPRDLRALPLQWYQGPVVRLTSHRPVGMVVYREEPPALTPMQGRLALQVGEHGVCDAVTATRLA